MLIHLNPGYVSSSVARYNQMTNFAAKLLSFSRKLLAIGGDLCAFWYGACAVVPCRQGSYSAALE